ncbi:MAG: stage III sporulation protein AA [Anaerotignum sp.]|nr:stage III sporulation protein AA [Anaerotignum sp.]
MLKEEGRIWFLEERVSAAELRETVSILSAYSLYAFEEELKQGYLTIEGGHRVGFCGKAVMENGEIRTLKQINALNIRIAREQKGWGEMILPDLMEGERFYHTLIVSPPGCGKTTLLRDIVRCLSERMRMVGVVDERGEIAPLRDGVPQMDVGRCTDILEGCPKAKGMVLLLRSMSPDVIAVDELGRREDVDAVYEVLHCGVKLIATAHGYDFDDIQNRLQPFLQKNIFERYLFLSNRNGTGTLEMILDKEGNIIRKGEAE